MSKLTPEQQAVIDEIAGRLHTWKMGYQPFKMDVLCARWISELRRTGLIQQEASE